MRCPFCSNIDTKVLNTRVSHNGSIRRRRSCDLCLKRFTTYEKVEEFNLSVRKRDGKLESFDEAKILRGLTLATEKRNLSHDILESIVAHIQKSVEESGRDEVSSEDLGLLVMNKLKEIDKVAYIRFASVYKNFEKLENFVAEIEELEK